MGTLSITVPVYNSQKRLRPCLDSILKQTFTAFELLLIDDGSKDGSGAVCDEYAARDERVIVIHKPNSGVSATRNLGLQKATGDYIMFVDSDDELPQNAAELLMRPILEYGVDYSAGNVEHYVGNKKITRYDQKPIDDIVTFERSEIAKSIYYNQGYAIGKIYKKEIIGKKKIAFNTDFSLGEDSLFVKDYLLHVNGIAVTSKSVYRYIHEDTKSLSGKYVENISDIYSALYEANMRLQERFGEVTNYSPKAIAVASAEINNIYKKGSPITTKEKRISYIKKKISDRAFKEGLKSWHPCSRPLQVTKLMFMTGNAWMIDKIYMLKRGI